MGLYLGEAEEQGSDRSSRRARLRIRTVRPRVDDRISLRSHARRSPHSARGREPLQPFNRCVRHLTAYARHFADRLAISAEFEASQAPLVTDRGNAIKRRAGNDIETLRQELTRRGWQ